MIAFTVILLSALAGGAVALAYGLKRAVMGYEDETGFHAEVPAKKEDAAGIRSTPLELIPPARPARPLGKKPFPTGPATV